MISELNDFLNYIEFEKGYSRNTLQTYKRYIKRFIDYLPNENINNLSMVNHQNFVNFMSHLKKSGLGANSIRLITEACKTFFRFLKKEEILTTNPLSAIGSPKVWNKVSNIISPREMSVLIDSPSLRHEQGVRDKAILELLYSSGLRISELCQLRFKHFDIEDRMVRVFGKGGKERVVPFTRRCLAALSEYWLLSRPSIGPEDYAIITFPHSTTPLNRMHVWSIIKKYAKQCGLSEKNIHPHTFRHCFASHLLDNGADLRVIQDLLGHSNVMTTDRYLHVSLKKTKQKFHKHHLRDAPVDDTPMEVAYQAV